MNNRIVITYLDDTIDPILSKFLKDDYKFKDVTLDYQEITYNQQRNTYEDIIKKIIELNTNLLVLDYKLYENKEQGKINGEDFSVLLKTFLPFLRIVIITQDEKLKIPDVIYKFKTRTKKNYIEYYGRELKHFLDNSIIQITRQHKILEDIINKKSFNKLTTQKIESLLNNNLLYDELKPSDIDKLVNQIKEIENLINDK